MNVRTIAWLANGLAWIKTKRACCQNRINPAATLILFVMMVSCLQSGGVAAQVPGTQSWNGENGILKASVQLARTLDESIETLDGISSVVGLEDGGAVVVSSGIAAVVEYDSNGKQIRKIGRWGEGPFEHVSPTAARLADDRLIVYDAGTLKFIVYDRTGNGVEEWRGLTKSISEFDVRGDVLVAFVAGSHQHYMMRLDRSTSDTLMFAPGSLLRSGLMTYQGNGRMGVRADKAYFMYPDEAVVREFDMKSRTETSYRLIDPDWRSDTSSLPADDFDDMNASFFDGRMVRYQAANSMSLGVLVLEDYTVALVEDGQFEIQGEPVPANRERVLKLFVFDRTMKFLDVIRLDKLVREKIGAVPLGVLGNSLLFVGAEARAGGATIDWTYRQLQLGRIQP